MMSIMSHGYVHSHMFDMTMVMKVICGMTFLTMNMSMTRWVNKKNVVLHKKNDPSYLATA